MDIPITYLVTAVVSIISGFILGYYISAKIYKNRSLINVLRYKHPEAWEIAHCVLAEEEQEEKEKQDTKAIRKQLKQEERRIQRSRRKN